ncbi:cyclic nucleotide-binding domain-containing protein [Sorangium sp. So ce296]|uniref:cyclic nucleotide-binding domain-containing protein n=1 Tax=Sorangium sp. So ce296 TaxID=3133296 RepID=UPI003F5F1BDC
MNHTESRVQPSSTSSADEAELLEVMSIAPSFRGLSRQHFNALLRTARIERVAAEHVIGHEGKRAQHLHLILKGEVSVFLGELLREVITIIARGGVFGGNLLIGEPNIFNYGAERDTVVASWSDEALRRAEATAPGLREQLSIRLSKDSRLTELSDILRNAPLLRNTSAVLRHRLLQETTLMSFPAGAFIYEEGTPASCCYLVVSGEVEITRATPEGERETLTQHGRGGVFGEGDLLASVPRTESAEAKIDTEVLAIDRIDIEALERACGSFRQAIAARAGSSKAPTKPQDVILVVNRTRYGTRDVASLLRSAFSAIGENRVAIQEVVPEGGAAVADAGQRLQLPRDPARALDALDEHVRKLGSRYVLLFTGIDNAVEWLSGPVWDKLIDRRVSSTVYFTDDLRQAFPLETPQLSPVQYVEVRPSNNKADVHMVRSGSIRLLIDAASGSDLRIQELPAASRSALHRLSRTLTHQSVGVALGGGAAWGYAHVPFLRALTEAGIPIDMVSGTSMGSVVAVLYGSRGVEGLNELLEAGPEFAWRFASAPITRKPLKRMFDRLMAHQYLQDLPLPTFPVAVDIQTGRARVFRHGPAFQATLASSAVPAAVVPEILDGVRYVDGGIANNVPVNCLVEEGADFIIASNVIPPPSRRAREVHKTPLTVFLSQISPLGRMQDTLRSMFLMMRESGTYQAAAAHLTFAPSALGEFNLIDFAAAKKIAAAAEPELPRFVELVKQKYKAFLRNRDY